MKRPTAPIKRKAPAGAAAAPKPRQRENAVLSDIRLAIGQRDDVLAVRIATGVFLIPNGTGQRIRSAPDGTPDLICTWRREITIHEIQNKDGFNPYERTSTHAIGQTVFIETKRLHGGKQSDEQIAFQAAAEKVGAIYILARSVEDVEAVIGTSQNRVGV